jgi:hypothetical protein
MLFKRLLQWSGVLSYRNYTIFSVLSLEREMKQSVFSKMVLRFGGLGASLCSYTKERCSVRYTPQGIHSQRHGWRSSTSPGFAARLYTQSFDARQNWSFSKRTFARENERCGTWVAKKVDVVEKSGIRRPST